MIESIIEYDHQLFYRINALWTNGFLDTLLPFIRNKYFWLPLYLFILSFFIINLKRKALWIIVGIIITIVLADQLSSNVMKPYFNRLRPCNDPSLIDSVRLLVSCGGGKSFTSSHATNHFSIALFIGLISKPIWRMVLPILLFWAGLISYAQVYVGVHFPIDVLCGALLGTLIGYAVYHGIVKVSGLKNLID